MLLKFIPKFTEKLQWLS